MRGEHGWWCFRPWCGSGSSPHARGTQGDGGDGDAVHGIIPACAGNTLAKCNNFKGYMDTSSSVSFTSVLRTICGVAYISHSPTANSPADFHHKVQRFRTMQDTGQYASRCCATTHRRSSTTVAYGSPLQQTSPSAPTGYGGNNIWLFGCLCGCRLLVWPAGYWRPGSVRLSPPHLSMTRLMRLSRFL